MSRIKHDSSYSVPQTTSRSSSISEVAPSWRQLSSRITDSALYPYLLRLAVLTYRIEPRFLSNDNNQLLRSKSPDGNSTLAVPSNAHKTHARSASDSGSYHKLHSSSDFTSSSSSSFSTSQKFPKPVPKLLLAKFEDMARPGTLQNNSLLKRCYLAYYAEMSDERTKKRLKDDRSAEWLITKFVSCAAKELSKAGVDSSEMKILVDQYCAAFVRLLIETIKEAAGHSSSYYALIKQLESYESSLTSARGEVLKARITKSNGTPSASDGISPPVAEKVIPTFKLDDMILAKDIGSLLLMGNTEIQRDIQQIKSEATVNLAVAELKSIQITLRGYDRHPIYQPIDFTSDEEYQEWKDSEVESINKQIAIYENATKFANNETLIPNPTKGLFYIPADTKSFYRHLLKRCLERDFTAAGNERLKNPESVTVLMSKSSIELLAKVANLWRIPNITRSVLLLDVSEEMFKEGLFSLDNLNDAFNLAKYVASLDKKTSNWNPNSWPYCDRVHFVTVLSELQKSIINLIDEALKHIYDESPPKLGPYLEALDEHILSYSEVKGGDGNQFIGLDASPRQIKRLKKTVIAVAEQKYGSLVDTIPRNHTLDPLHIIDLADKVISIAKRLQKRYKFSLFDKISIAVISAERHLTMFSLDSQSMFDYLLQILSSKNEEPEFNDMIVLYKKMTEIRDLFVQVSDSQFGFDIETNFNPFIVQWAESSSQLAQTWVEPAIQKDNFLPIDKNDGVMNSSSVIDTFQSFRGLLDIINELQWRNEVQLARIQTIVMKGISSAVCQYADRLLYLFLEDLKTSEVQQPQIRSRQDKWLHMAKSAVNGKEKVIPYNFLTETCVKLNDIELAQIRLDQIESEMNSEQVFQRLSQAERTQKKPSSFLFNVKIIQAEGLKACDMNGLSDPYVTLVDQTNRKQIGKTRTIYEDLNPIWNELFEVATTGSKLLVATVWDENSLQNHDLCGRAFIRLDPSAFQDFVSQDVWLDLDIQGRLLVNISMESERDDIRFYFGKSLRTLMRTEGDMIKLIVDKFTAFIKYSISIETMKSLQGVSRFNMDTLSSWFNKNGSKPSQGLTKDDIEDSLNPLFDYLNENFATLAGSLTKDLKIKVMTQTWNIILETIDLLLLPPLSDRRTTKTQLSSIEVEIVFTWLSAMKDFFHHDGVGPPLEILQSQKYQQLIDTTIFYNWTTSQLQQESEKMLSQSFKSLKEKNYLASPEALMKRKNTVMAHRNRTVVKKQNEQLRMAQRETPQTEDIILRILKTRGEHDYVSRRLKQREKVGQALASESIANAGFRRGYYD